MKKCAWIVIIVWCGNAQALPRVGVWQYEGGGMVSNAWRAAGEGESLVALHGASNGWDFAEVRQVGKQRVMRFGAGASAFGFSADATNRVAVVMLCHDRLLTFLS